MKRSTDESGNYHSYYYDELNRLVRETVNESNDSLFHEYLKEYSYETVDNVLLLKVINKEKEGNETVITSIRYFDSRGQLVKETSKGKSVEISYDSLGNIIQISHWDNIDNLRYYRQVY